MSDYEEGGHRDAELDRIDALISAAMDDELDSGEREELRALLAQDEELAARVRAFHQVDASLRALAADLPSEERLSEGLAALTARLGPDNGATSAARSDPGETAQGVEIAEASKSPNPEARLLRNRFGAIGLAAAAALAMYLLVPQSGPEQTQGGAIDESDSGAAAVAEGAEPSPEEELASALGYADDSAAANLGPGIPLDDLEIIEQLELLEYLAARDSEGRG